MPDKTPDKSAEDKEKKGPEMEKHFREMRQKVRDFIKRVEFDHTMKKLLKKDPVAVLLAADIGFVSEAEVHDFLLWELTNF